MLFIKYTKTGPARFLSHLDVLRHFNLTIGRAGLQCNYSQGFNPHRLLFFGNPLGVGLASVCEHVSIDSTEEPATFTAKFNAVAPEGVKIVEAKQVDKKVNIQATIKSITYEILLKDGKTITLTLEKRPEKYLEEKGLEWDLITKIGVDY